MRNGVLTRWDLMPHEKFLTFLVELVDYLKQKRAIQNLVFIHLTCWLSGIRRRTPDIQKV